MLERYSLPGSDRRELKPHGVVQPRCHENERATVTIRLTTDDTTAITAVCSWAISHRLAPTFASPAQKLVQVVGTVDNLENAFGVELHRREIPGGGTHRAHYGPVSVPAVFAPLISGVFGLDDRPCARPRLARNNQWFDHGLREALADELFGKRYQKPPGTFLPLEVAEAYQFPHATGKGQTIALIELGGGFRPADLRAYWSYLGITGPTVTAVGVNGGRNQPGSDADAEVQLDIQVAGSIANEATILVVFTGNTSRDFLDAMSFAVHDKDVSVVSVSWGGPEDTWADADKTAFDAICKEAADLGVTITVASGDSGSSDGENDGRQHVDFPASSGWVTGCGGTHLTVGQGTNDPRVAPVHEKISEVVWNDGGQGSGGGGCSTFFPKPLYQTAAICGDKRSVPDVAANSDPTSGYIVRVDSRMQPVGGTSAAAPLVAGLVARLNQITGKRLGFLNPLLYKHPAICNDITEGSNGSFTAQVGPDCCTGLGSINGTRLLEVLQA